jgi:uncharacterized protein DUF6390
MWLRILTAPSRANIASDGLLRLARYAFMPNLLGYCGGDGANRALYRYVLAKMPYLRLIAHANGLADPFNERVAEASWIGNDLLRRVEARQLYVHLAGRFSKQLQGRTHELVLGKAPAGARRFPAGNQVGNSPIGHCGWS